MSHSKSPKPLPTKEILDSILIYHPLIGRFIWKERPLEHFASEGAMKTWNKRFAGTEAGCINKSNGYRIIAISGVRYKAHRLIFMIMTGNQIPEGFSPDHINRERLDNRWSNLELKSSSENNRNRTPQKNNTSGFVGVYANGKNWQTQAFLNGKTIYIGTYQTPELAFVAYCQWEINSYGNVSQNTKNFLQANPEHLALVPALLATIRKAA